MKTTKKKYHRIVNFNLCRFLLVLTAFFCCFSTVFSYAQAAPADPDLIPQGRDILNYFESIYQSRTVSAIWNNQTRLVDTVNNCSGKFPAIIGEDLSGWNQTKWSNYYDINIQKALDRLKTYWHEKGGIAQVNFHWGNPLTAGGTFSDSQEKLTDAQWNNITRPGTSEYETMLSDLNRHLDYLQQLTDENIPVLWRPLHEIDGGWFWWTNKNDPAKTVELWKIIYDQMVNVRGMHNFIWVWSSSEINPVQYDTAYRARFYPGDQYVDIIGVDLYHWDYSNTGTRDYWNGQVSYQDMFDIVQAVAPSKMTALCECQALPNAQKTQNNDPNFAKWLYALPWWGGTDANPCSWIESTYGNSYYLNLNDLPVFNSASDGTIPDDTDSEIDEIDTDTSTDVEPADTDTSTDFELTDTDAGDAPTDSDATGYDTDTSDVTDSESGEDIVLQAEEYSGRSGGKKDTYLEGYSGSGYYDMGGSGSFVEYIVNVTQAGVYDVDIRYANGSSADRACDVIVNGVAETNLFDITGDWTTWSDSPMSVALEEGDNTIRIQAATDRGGPNIDRLVIYGAPQEVEPDMTDADTVTDTDATDIDTATDMNETETQTDGADENTSTDSADENTSTDDADTDTATADSGSSGSDPTIPAGAMTPGANLMNIGWYNGWSDFFAQGVDWTTTTNPWNPDFINELKQAKIRCLRFMDWNVVNFASVRSWNQRIAKTAGHYNMENLVPSFVDHYDSATNTHNLEWDAKNYKGVALEWQIDLCNRVNADMWINVPAAADADFQRQLAQLIKSQLNPDLKVYIEWSNEIWNWGFPTTPYAWEQAKDLGLDQINVGGWCDPWRKYYVYASVRLFEQFEAVFGQDSDRLVRVLCGQVGYKAWPEGSDYNNQTYGDMLALQDPQINPNGTKIDAFGVAPYMGNSSMAAMKNAIPNLVAGITRVKNALEKGGRGNIPVICYEGGSDNYPDSNLALAKDPQQEQLYVDYLNALDDVVEGVFTQFSFTGGTWGLKAKTGTPESDAPKWKGWLRYWN